jgi:hypothetical protein
VAASGLSFTSDLVAKPQDESMTELRQHAALQLIAANNLEELRDLMDVNDGLGDDFRLPRIIGWNLPSHAHTHSEVTLFFFFWTSVFIM